MHDLKWIRANAEELKIALQSRGVGSQIVDALWKSDTKHRQTLTALQDIDSRRNRLAEQIGKAIKENRSSDVDSLKIEAALLASERVQYVELAEALGNQCNVLALMIPNIPMPDVPHGLDETSNLEIRRWGEPRIGKFKLHDEIGVALDEMDFETAAKMSGSRFVITKGTIARLERALGQFMLDFHCDLNGYLEVNPPLMVRADAMRGTGQLPKFEDDLFKAGEHYLIPTAEVPLTNMVRESILAEAALTQRFAALTPCFRAEAGSAGRDTRGMIRQHQFHKVELVSLTTEEDSDAELHRTVNNVERVLQALGLAYRTVLLCTGDMGFSARKTYDVEVWLPGQQAYREISSISYFGDFQGRRMNARYRPEQSKILKFIHTINGSGVAVGRALAAILETYQNDDGTFVVPEVLRPYMSNRIDILPA